MYTNHVLDATNYVLIMAVSIHKPNHVHITLTVCIFRPSNRTDEMSLLVGTNIQNVLLASYKTLDFTIQS